MIFVQSSAQANWCRFLERTPRNTQSDLPVYDIPDGSERADPFDPDSERFWAEENGVNIMGTPWGLPLLSQSTYRGSRASSISSFFDLSRTWLQRDSLGRPSSC